LKVLKIKGKFNYTDIQSLSTEARQKLIKIDPETIAQASRIPGFHQAISTFFCSIRALDTPFHVKQNILIKKIKD
jgi:tRNA U34 5-carboxymethylaminomethyl modifying enzyme MnmG/GidA